MKRFQQPLNYYTNEDLMSLPTIKVEGREYRVLVRDERVRVTACQCFKDCDCNGSVSGEIVNYYRDVRNDGTDRCFYERDHVDSIAELQKELKKILEKT